MLTITTTLNPKELRGLIVMLIKSKTATEIKKINYLSSYHLDTENPKKITKTQEKILLIFFEENKKEKLLSLLSKQKNITIMPQI